MQMLHDISIFANFPVFLLVIIGYCLPERQPLNSGQRPIKTPENWQKMRFYVIQILDMVVGNWNV